MDSTVFTKKCGYYTWFVWLVICDLDKHKSNIDYVFTLASAAISWKYTLQSMFLFCYKD